MKYFKKIVKTQCYLATWPKPLQFYEIFRALSIYFNFHVKFV